MKKIKLILSVMMVMGGLFGPGVSEANAIDMPKWFDFFRDRHQPIPAVTLCVKNSGAVYVVGEGFKKADCKKMTN